MTIFGVDCSDFDWGRGPMDVAAMARDGIAFMTHKATEGTRTVHTRYGEALNRARAAGIKAMGAYVVPRTPGNNGHGTVAAQVDYFLSYLDKQTPWWRDASNFFLQVDLEKWPYDAVAPTIGVQMADLLAAKTGKRVILYAPQWAYGNAITGTHPLWASSYGSNPATHYASAYPGDSSGRWGAYSGRTPAILQYGSKLTVGSQPGMDVNAFRGSVADLLTLIGAGRTEATSVTPVSKPTATAPAWPGRYIKLSSPMMHGADVQTWQAQMKRRGWPIDVDSWFGPQANTVLRQFQREKGLVEDGILGPASWGMSWTAPVT